MEELRGVDDLGVHPLHLFHDAHTEAVCFTVGSACANEEMERSEGVACCIVNAVIVLQLTCLVKVLAAFLELICELFISGEFALLIEDVGEDQKHECHVHCGAAVHYEIIICEGLHGVVFHADDSKIVRAFAACVLHCLKDVLRISCCGAIEAEGTLTKLFVLIGHQFLSVLGIYREIRGLLCKVGHRKSIAVCSAGTNKKDVPQAVLKFLVQDLFQSLAKLGKRFISFF